MAEVPKVKDRLARGKHTNLFHILLCVITNFIRKWKFRGKEKCIFLWCLMIKWIFVGTFWDREVEEATEPPGIVPIISRPTAYVFGSLALKISRLVPGPRSYQRRRPRLSHVDLKPLFAPCDAVTLQWHIYQLLWQETSDHIRSEKGQ